MMDLQKTRMPSESMTKAIVHRQSKHLIEGYSSNYTVPHNYLNSRFDIQTPDAVEKFS
jgi:hypothetical protein